MAFIEADRVQETTTTVGTGNISPEGAIVGCVTFDSVLAAGDTFSYCVNNGIGAWEVGIGVWNDSTLSFLRNVIKSSNSDTLVNFIAGTKNVFLNGRNSQNVSAEMATIVVTAAATTDKYIIAPVTGNLVSGWFSSAGALATNDTNYITFSCVNLGQTGSGTTEMINTTCNTKTTGGIALSINTKYNIIVHSTFANTAVIAGDRLRFRTACSGTPVPTTALTLPVFSLTFSGIAK